MSMFTATNAELPGGVANLTPELAKLADEAVETGLRYDGPNTEEVQKAIGAIKRYLNKKGWTVKVVPSGNTLSWQAREKTERAPMTEEHKIKLAEGRAAAKAAKEASATV